jgi:hypothetical protein
MVTSQLSVASNGLIQRCHRQLRTARNFKMQSRALSGRLSPLVCGIRNSRWGGRPRPRRTTGSRRSPWSGLCQHEKRGPTEVLVRRSGSAPHPELFNELLTQDSRGSPPSLRFGQLALDAAEHFLHNRGASVATLRWCSGSSRKVVRLAFGMSVQLRQTQTCLWRWDSATRVRCIPG